MEEKSKILVVDDEPGMRLGAKRIFELEGYYVKVASCGQEGIDMGLSEEFDVILLDLQMPDVDGLTVLKTLRETYPETEYIMITAFAGFDSAVEAAKIGAYTYVPKPFTPDQIILEVTRALDKRRLTLEARKLREEKEKRLLEIHLEQSKLTTIINSINDAVIVTNLERGIALVNPKTRSMFQSVITAEAGEKIDAILPKEVCDHITNAAEKFQLGIEKVSMEWEMKPNLEMVVILNTAPMRDYNNETIGYVTTIQDVTELKKLDQQKSQFVSMVAHELKAPLAAISGYLETMQGKLLGNDISTYEKMIDRSFVRLKALVELINDLLSISRRELGKIQREITAVDVKEVIEEVLEFHRQEASKKGVKFELYYSHDVSTIDIDKNDFTRLITNLVSNGIKYNSQDGILNIKAQKEGNSTIIKVSDTGIGMKPEELKNLFQQFYRAKNEKTRSIPGTGLGLSIVKSLVESYHGNVNVESEYGKGTTFSLRFVNKFISAE